MRKDKTITLLQAYDQDLERFKHRVGKDRSEHSLRSMQQGRQYVAAFLTDWMHTDDIQLAKLMPQFIHDFSVYLSTDRGLREYGPRPERWHHLARLSVAQRGSHQGACPRTFGVEPLRSVPYSKEYPSERVSHGRRNCPADGPRFQEACTLLRARHLYICSLHRFGFYRHQGTQAFRYGHHQWWHMDCLKAT